MNNKRKILVLLASKHSLPPTKDCSGIAWLIHGVINELSSFDIITISPYKGPSSVVERINYFPCYTYDNNWKEKIIIFFLRSIPNRLRKSLFFSNDPSKILRCIKVAWTAKKFDADVVISHVYPTLFLFASKFSKKQAKQVFYHHGSLLQELPKNQLAYFSKYCAGLITLSDFALRDSLIKKKYFTFPIRKIMNAVTTEFSESRIKLTDPFFVKYGIFENSFSILYAGSLIPGKGIHILIQAVNDLASYYPNIKLLIVGKIPDLNDSNYQYFKELELQATQLSNVIKFAGWITHEKLIQLYKFFNLSVLLSKEQEGNSLFLIESITQGTPVIASRIGGNPDVVDEGLTGLLIDDPENVNEVKYKIRSLIDNEVFYQQMRGNCLKIGREKFSYSNSAAELENFINVLIHGGKVS